MSGAPRRRSGPGEGGFVLVAVLVVLALMAGVVGTASLAARGAAGSARLAADRLAADALVDGGVALAAYQLYGLGHRAADVDGQSVTFDDGTVVLGVVPETARIDLNAASAAMLAGLWRALARPGRAEAFAAAVTAWRATPADPSGAEPADDVDGAAGDTRHGPFQSVAALVSVAGVTSEDVAAMAPYLTVFNPSGTIDPRAAPRAVLASLPGVTAATVDAIVALRAGEGDIVARIRAIAPAAAGHLGLEARAYRLRVTARHRALGPTTVEAVITRGARRGALYHVLDWRAAR
ncbi:type II secretion system protein GspK [Acuticoccus sp. I52.16.1]|uniref:type II secretion system protein GspK n=1 Tax=Acuticoccus sp. I52.16.1 TaxID=2928472 RepID=UPI001FD16788|nr:type II secretion system protein GspK [Acuticoccus sp. I52.16.1]UOM34660.1 general secretion pathway protein GspK [Acuticoccus sp. I52.16.1]